MFIFFYMNFVKLKYGLNWDKVIINGFLFRAEDVDGIIPNLLNPFTFNYFKSTRQKISI